MTRRLALTGLLSVATLFTAFAASSAMAAHLANPNRLVNEGFEAPIANTGDPFVGRWQPFSADGDEVTGPDTAQTGTTMPRTDASALEIEIAGVVNSFAGAFQDVVVNPADAGSPAWFSGWNKLSSGTSGGSEIRIEWRDSVSNTEISRTPNLVTDLTADYSEFVVTDTVPVGANLARVVYAIQSFGGIDAQVVLVDDTNFNVQIPEPTTVCLAALGLVSALGLRRRS